VAAISDAEESSLCSSKVAVIPGIGLF
jgi:hypothetical protein